MALFGKFMKMGDKLGTDYAQNEEGMYELLDDFYGGIMKSAGAPTYGEDNGYFRAIMGKEVMAGMYSSDNIWSIIGSTPYNHEGVRIALQLATYGVGPDGKWHGIGAGTVQDGAIAAPVKMPVYTFRQPAKDITFAFDYGMTLMAFENKDDVSAYKDYVDKMSINFSNYLDQTILRPVEVDQDTGISEDDGVTVVETSLNSIWRCIASYKDMDRTDKTITSNQICPYGGDEGDFNKRALPHTSQTAPAAYKNLSGQLVDLKGGVPTIADFRKLYRVCSKNWGGNGATDNKVWIMSLIGLDKISALHMANNVQLDTVFAQHDFKGIKTFPGREGGYMLNAYMNIPILVDSNINFDFDTLQGSDVKYGDIGLLDLNHISNRILTPLSVYNVDNPLLNYRLQERNLFHMRCETYIDNFITSGRMVGIADDA